MESPTKLSEPKVWQQHVGKWKPNQTKIKLYLVQLWLCLLPVWRKDDWKRQNTEEEKVILFLLKHILYLQFLLILLLSLCNSLSLVPIDKLWRLSGMHFYTVFLVLFCFSWSCTMSRWQFHHWKLFTMYWKKSMKIVKNTFPIRKSIAGNRKSKQDGREWKKKEKDLS